MRADVPELTFASREDFRLWLQDYSEKSEEAQQRDFEKIVERLNENDPNTCFLHIRLTDGVFF